MKFVTAIYLLFLLYSCKTHTQTESPSNTGSQVNAGSCRIEASVVKVFEPDSQDTNDVCFKNPCDAIVHIERIMQCGSAASIIPDDKGEIKVHFVNSLKPVASDSETKPGLKAGSLFRAIVETRQAPGDKINYVIYFYEVR